MLTDEVTYSSFIHVTFSFVRQLGLVAFRQSNAEMLQIMPLSMSIAFDVYKDIDNKNIALAIIKDKNLTVQGKLKCGM